MLERNLVKPRVSREFFHFLIFNFFALGGGGKIRFDDVGLFNKKSCEKGKGIIGIEKRGRGKEGG